MFQIPEEVPVEGPMFFIPSSYLPLIFNLLNFFEINAPVVNAIFNFTLIPRTFTFQNETYIPNLC